MKRASFRLLWAVLAALVFSMAAPSRGAVLYKSYLIKRDQGREVLCDPYIVGENEAVFSMLGRHGELAKANFSEFLHLFRRLNPHIRDLHRIRTGEHIFIPPGRWRSSVPLVLRDYSVTLTGEGPGRSVLECPGVEVALYADGHQTESRRARLDGFRVVGGDVAVTGTLRQLGTKMATVRDVILERGGFRFRDVWGLRVDTCHADLRPVVNRDAYLLTGYCVDSTLTACYAVGAGFRVQFEGWGQGTPEGVCLMNCHALATQHGLYYDASLLQNPDGVRFHCPWLTVQACHFEAFARAAGETPSGITVKRGSALWLKDNLIFHVTPDHGAPFTGIDLQDVAEGRVAGNSVYLGSTHQAQTGIHAGGQALSITDNRLLLTHDGDVGIRVPADADDIRLRGNMAPAGRERQLYAVHPAAKRVQGVRRPFQAVCGPEAWQVPASSVEALQATQDGQAWDLGFYLSDTTITRETPYLTLGLPGVVLERTQTVGHGWYHGRAAQFLVAAHPGDRHLRLYTLDMGPWQPGYGGVYLGAQIRLELDA